MPDVQFYRRGNEPAADQDQGPRPRPRRPRRRSRLPLEPPLRPREEAQLVRPARRPRVLDRRSRGAHPRAPRASRRRPTSSPPRSKAKRPSARRASKGWRSRSRSCGPNPFPTMLRPPDVLAVPRVARVRSQPARRDPPRDPRAHRFGRSARRRRPRQRARRLRRLARRPDEAPVRGDPPHAGLAGRAGTRGTCASARCAGSPWSACRGACTCTRGTRSSSVVHGVRTMARLGVKLRAPHERRRGGRARVERGGPDARHRSPEPDGDLSAHRRRTTSRWGRAFRT